MSGLVCPSCGGTFRAGFTRCASCQCDLVTKAEWEAALASRDDPRRALAGKTLVPVVHSSIAACREIERALLDAQVPCLVQAERGEGDVLATGAMKVGVFVATDDLPRVQQVLSGRFRDDVAREGRGVFRTEAIDLTAAEIECPACGHRGPLKDGECADCGLFLGAPEEPT